MKSRAESNGGKVQYLDVHKAELEVGNTNNWMKIINLISHSLNIYSMSHVTY